MNYSQIIDTIGSIAKLEQLVSVDSGILNNTLVLRNNNPFPGIRTADDKSAKHSFFIILRYRYAPEKVNRINARLIQLFQFSRFPSYGEITAADQILPCVRIKEVNNPEIIPQIQNTLKQFDLQLMTFHEIDMMCPIKIFKTFKLAEIGDGLYRDLVDSEKFYIRIKPILNLKRLESITKYIRNHIPNPDFDAAVGVIYRFMGPENVIRIYDKDITHKRAIELRKYFLQEIKNEIHLSPAQPHF